MRSVSGPSVAVRALAGGLAGLSAALTGLSLWLHPVAAKEPGLEPQAVYSVSGDLGGKKGKAAKDISGIACMDPPGSATFRCLLVNDENVFAQFVTIRGAQIVPGDKVTLIGDAPDTATLGSLPTVDCPDPKPTFADLDGEGVAYAKPYYYVIGSHGCSRYGGEFKAAAFVLARFRIDEQGRVVGRDGKAARADAEPSTYVETTYRVSEALRKVPQVAGAFGKALMTAEDGLNIEGVAVEGDRIVVGLRCPEQKQARLPRRRLDRGTVCARPCRRCGSD
jgi:hypothetical protein